MKTLQIFDASEGTGTARGEGGVGNRKCFKPVGCGGQQNLASSAEGEAVQRSGGRHVTVLDPSAQQLRARNEMCTIKDAISH